MAIRRILTIDNAADLAILKQVSKPVAAVDDAVRALMDDMLETMYDAPGIGLAAVQIGALDRVIVMDLGDKDGVVCETEEEAAEQGPIEVYAASFRPMRSLFAGSEARALMKLLPSNADIRADKLAFDGIDVVTRANAGAD